MISLPFIHFFSFDFLKISSRMRGCVCLCLVFSFGPSSSWHVHHHYTITTNLSRVERWAILYVCLILHDHELIVYKKEFKNRYQRKGEKWKKVVLDFISFQIIIIYYIVEVVKVKVKVDLLLFFHCMMMQQGSFIHANMKILFWPN